MAELIVLHEDDKNIGVVGDRITEQVPVAMKYFAEKFRFSMELLGRLVVNFEI
jgi:hypothetical protein